MGSLALFIGVLVALCAFLAVCAAKLLPFALGILAYCILRAIKRFKD